MKNLRRVLLLSFVISLIIFPLFAGGQAEGEKIVTLKFFETMTSPRRTELLKSIIADYEAENPGVIIELISPPYEQASNKLSIMLTSGQELDIVEVRGHTVKQYVNNDSIIDLTPYLDAWDDAPDILPLANSIARTVDNTPYLIPQSFYIKA